MAGEQYVQLPEEVWETILESLEDSMDILNVFQLFPHLYNNVMRNRNAWLLDQALPFILPWLKTNGNILAVRAVSKRWLRAVDNLVQNHPDRRPPAEAGLEVARQRHYGIAEGSSPHYYRIGSYFSDFSYQIGTRGFRRFNHSMEAHPPERNPFITRRVAISGYHYPGTEDAEAQFLGETEEWVHRFGQHIWYLDLNLGRSRMDLDYLDALFPSLPHLKALKLERHGINEDEQIIHFQPLQFNWYFPVLKELETLEFEGLIHAPLCHVIIDCYSPQIKRLMIEDHLWRPEYSNMFPELSELTLSVGRWEPYEPFPIIPSLNAPKLTRLELDVALNVTADFEKELSPLKLDMNFIPSLERFPSLRNFFLDFPNWSPCWGNSAMCQEMVTIPSIKYFVARAELTSLSLGFLKIIPNLEYLLIDTGPRRFKIKDIYKLAAWELLTSLKQITVLKVSAPPKTFTRARYEYLQPENAFQSFVSMVSGDWRRGEGSIELNAEIAQIPMDDDQ